MDAFSEATMVSVMTQDEIREKIGLAPLEAKDRVMMEDQTDEFIFDHLKGTGYRESELEVIQTFNEPITCIEDAEMLETNFMIKHGY